MKIYLSPPHMGEDEQKLVAEAFASNWISSVGPHVDAFEREIAEYTGVPGAVALSSGTAAIHLALRLLGVERGDTVFCSTLTFIGSCNPILYEGAVPVFIDSDHETWNMSPAALKRAFEDADRRKRLPKAVIVVDLYGQSADKEPILALCERYGVPMIEDSAEALGTTYRDRPCGGYGKFGIFSFNGNKIITTSGGGMLVSHDLKALQKAKFLSTQARDPAPHYQHSEMGFNYRLSNVLAAIGRGQLRVLNDRVAARRAIFKRYQEAFTDVPEFEFMPEAPFGKSTRWLTTLRINPKRARVKPEQVLKALLSKEIEGRPVWKPLHLQPLFEGAEYYPHQAGESVSDDLFLNGICLPSGSSMTIEQQTQVIETIRSVL